MFKKKIKGRLSVFLAVAATFLSLMTFGVLLSCVSPGALQTEIQGIRLDMDGIEKVTDELVVWKKNIQAETINYGGAGWVVVGTGVMALIFVGAGLLLTQQFIKRGRILGFLTGAIQQVGKYSPETIQIIKKQLKQEIADGRSTEQDKKHLGSFARKRGAHV